MKKVDIIRFYKNGKKRLVMAGITLEKAQAWCASDKTKTSNYFDGFTGGNIYKCQDLTALYPQNYTLDDIK